MTAAAKAQMQETFDCRVAFAETLLELAAENPKVVAVCNDSVGSSNLGEFAETYPDRLINVGIAEQCMVGTAAGLANGGFVPFVCAASPFLTGRALEQIKADVAYNDYPVVLCGMSPGMAYGELGPTHHSTEDFAWTRAIADLTVLVPADPAQTRAAVRWAAGADRPIFMRIGRFKVPSVTEDEDFRPDRMSELAPGTDVSIVATGTMVSRALEARDLLAGEGISAQILNASTLKPLDENTLVNAARRTGRIVTAEEAYVHGGLGSAVASVVSQAHPVPMRILGVTEFAPTGDTAFLIDHFGLNANGIAAAARELVG